MKAFTRASWLAGVLLLTILQTGYAAPASSSPQTSSTPGVMDRMETSIKNMLSPDKRFLKDVAGDALAEIQLGTLAQKNSTNPNVKDFAARMVDDHARLDGRLTEIAVREKIELPTGLGLEDTILKVRLEKLHGPAFDNAYMKAMVNGHQKAVAAFENETKKGSDDSIKSLAVSELPVIEKHLQLAQGLVGSAMTEKVPTTKPAIQK